MSLDSRTPTPTPHSRAPKFKLKLAAHTERASLLAERLFHGKISQHDYDAQVHATSIVSADLVSTVPIVLALDDTLDALIAYANREFSIRPPRGHVTELYVPWSMKLFYAVSIHPPADNMVLLDEDRLEMILAFMQESTEMEQFFVQVEKDVKEVRDNVEALAEQLSQAEAEEDAHAWEDMPTLAPYSKPRSSAKGKGQSASKKGKEREHSPEVDRDERAPVTARRLASPVKFELGPAPRRTKKKEKQEALPEKKETKKKDKQEGPQEKKETKIKDKQPRTPR